MSIAIEKMFAKLLFWLYDMLDALSEIFGVLAGTEKLEYDGGNQTLIDIFLSHETVTQVFLALLLVSVAVCALCMVAGVVKGIIAIRAENRHSPMHTVGLGFTAFIATFAMVIVLFAGITFSNELLQVINKYVLSDGNATLSQRLFDISVEKSYTKIYADAGDCEIRVSYVLTYQGEEYTDIETDNEGSYYITSLGIWVTGTEYDSLEMTESLIYGGTSYPDYYAIYDEDDVLDSYVIYSGSYDDNGVWQRDYVSGYNTYVDSDGNTVYYTASDIDFSTTSVNTVFGVHKKTLGLFEDGDKSYTRSPMVFLDSFNMWTAYLTVVIIIFALLWSMLGLVKRLYDIVMLYLVMPIITATIPLDEGARFKTWRDTVVSKVILAYGTILAVNVFLLIVPIIGGLEITGLSSTVNTIFKMLLYIGGALSISGGQLLVARLAGTDASEFRDMANSARTLIGGTRTAAGLALGAKRLAVGGTNRYGKQTRGVLPTALGVGNRAAETVGGGRYMNSNGAYVMRKLSRAPSNDRRNAANTAHAQASMAKYEAKTAKRMQKAEDKGRFDKSAMTAAQKANYKQDLKEYNGKNARKERAFDNKMDKSMRKANVKDYERQSEYSKPFNDWAKNKYGNDYSNASYMNKAPTRSQELAKNLAVPKQDTAQKKD